MYRWSIGLVHYAYNSFVGVFDAKEKFSIFNMPTIYISISQHFGGVFILGVIVFISLKIVEINAIPVRNVDVVICSNIDML